MDVVVFNDVALIPDRFIAPVPAQGDAGVPHVVDVIVANTVATGITDEDTNSTVEDPPAAADLAVTDRRALRTMPGFDTTCTQIFETTAEELIVAAVIQHFDGPIPQV